MTFSSAANKRILLYSHDTVGLGHMRRNQAIAESLASSLENPSILMVSGARECTMLDVAKCVDYVTVPSLKKTSDGNYSAKSGALSTTDATVIRRDILKSVVDNFRPDVMIVDKVPNGVNGELLPALERIRKLGNTRCVLGLRDILDDPQVAKSDWDQNNCEAVIHDFYDAIWVYGDQTLYDLGQECNFSPRTRKLMSYVGYLDRTLLPTCHNDESYRAEESNDISSEFDTERISLCMVGGGEDGAHVASAFAHADQPDGMCGVIVTGPFMPARLQSELKTLAASNPKLRIVDFAKRPEQLLARADRVVAMGGYNTICEILAQDKCALIVPRVEPRTEQLIRAQRMSQLGLLDMLHPSQLTSETISSWMRKTPTTRTDIRKQIDFDGMTLLPKVFCNLFQQKPRMTPANRIDQPDSVVLGQPHVSKIPVS